MKRPIRYALVVTGDRHASAEAWRPMIQQAIDGTVPRGAQDVVLIHGDCDGIDRIAGTLGYSLGCAVLPVPAMWDRDGSWAGPRRNRIMLKMLAALGVQGYETRVLAFHDNLDGSKGTRNCVEQAAMLGLDIERWTTSGRMM